MEDFSALAQLQRELARKTETMRLSLGPAYELQRAFRENESIWRNQMAGYADILAWRDSLSRDVERLMPTLRLAEHLRVESDAWSGLIRQFSATQETLSTLAYPARVWQDSLTNIVGALGLIKTFDRFPSFASHLLEPYDVYSKFARVGLEELDHVSDEREELALSTAIALAEEQVSGGTDLIVDSLADIADDVPESVAETHPPIVNLFQIQKEELLARGDLIVVVSSTELVETSPAALTAKRARTIVELAIHINRTAKLAGDEEIFKPTTSYIEAQNLLQWVVVTSERELGALIDALYIMLYEAAGSDDLRYLDLIGKDECQVVWTVKHLRNKLLRHDPDHGANSSQNRSWEQLRQALSWLGLNTLPRATNEYRHMQDRLMREVEAFLERIYGALRQRGPNLP